MKILEAQPTSAHDTLVATLIQTRRLVPDQAPAGESAALLSSRGRAERDAERSDRGAACRDGRQLRRSDTEPAPLSFPVRVYYPTPSARHAQHARCRPEQVDETVRRSAVHRDRLGRSGGREGHGCERHAARGFGSVAGDPRRALPSEVRQRRAGRDDRHDESRSVPHPQGKRRRRTLSDQLAGQLRCAGVAGGGRLPWRARPAAASRPDSSSPDRLFLGPAAGRAPARRAQAAACSPAVAGGSGTGFASVSAVGLAGSSPRTVACSRNSTASFAPASRIASAVASAAAARSTSPARAPCRNR